MNFKTVRLLLGDQLNAQHSWFKKVDDDVLYIIAELHQETGYVTHHIQKVVAFFLAMQEFAKARQEEGHQVVYLTLDETQNFSDLPQLIAHYVQQTGAMSFEYQRPDEYRLFAQLANLRFANTVIGCVNSEHFLLPFEEIEQHFPKGKHKMMEHFYRRMRQRFTVLIEDGKPLAGQWNFDASNRNKLKAQDIAQLPEPLLFKNNPSDVLARLNRHGIQTIGHLKGDLFWPINRAQSLTLLAHFCQVCYHALANFRMR